MMDDIPTDTVVSRRGVIAALIAAFLSHQYVKPFVPAERHQIEVLNVTLSRSGNYVSATAVIDVDVDIWMTGQFRLTANGTNVYLPGTEKTGRVLIETGKPSRITATWRVNDVVKNQVEGCVFRVIEVDR